MPRDVRSSPDVVDWSSFPAPKPQSALNQFGRFPFVNSSSVGSSEALCPPTSLLPVERARWFSEEVHPHDDQLKAYLRRAFPLVRDIDDVVQESYLRIWKARGSHPIASARAFLFTVARRLALKTATRYRTSPVETRADFASVPIADERPNPAEALGYSEKVALLAAALRSLPPRCREIVIRRKLLGQPQRDAARELGLSERTVENQLARGVTRCETWLRARGLESSFDR